MPFASATANRVPARPALRALERQPRRSPAVVRLCACRPRQWSKNALVVLAPAAAGVLTRPAVIGDVLGAFACFCLLSSATYLVNDLRDREQDQRHPRKRHRPIASGELAPGSAARLAVRVAIGGIALALVVRPLLAIVAAGYVLLTTSYSLWWRRVVVADVLAVAGGFLLRAIGGGAASGVGLSRAFLVVTYACSLYLVVGKRYAELLAAGSGARARATLRRYSRRSLRLLLSATAVLGCVAYAWWAFARVGPGPWRTLSMVPFLLWLARYRWMLGIGAGEAPEELLVQDIPLLGLGLIWLVLFTLAVYGPA